MRCVLVTSSNGTPIAHIHRTADGLISQIKYGDSAQTKTDFTYDTRRRLLTQKTHRSPFSYWTSPPGDYQPPPNPDANYLPSFQRILQDDYFFYDIVGNPTYIDDQRAENHWPDHAKPVDRSMTYDDLYRLKSIDYVHAGSSSWLSPFDPENTGADTDPRHAKPSPHVSFGRRVQRQTYDYDWLGNTSATTDDDTGFYDRSLGTITNGPVTGSAPKPYQLQSASNEATAGSPVNNEGNLGTVYDVAGNLTRMNLRRAGTCLPSGALCDQRFAYDWDEVGRLVKARRWDVTPATLGNPTDPLPSAAPDVTLQYTYDAGDQRVIKTAEDPLGEQLHTLYVFETLEVRRADWIDVDPGAPVVFDYELTKWTEVPYFFSQGVRLGRIVHEPSSPTLGTDVNHYIIEIGDHLGSSSIAIDRRTAELVERGTYLAYGGTDTDYRTDRWNEFREDYRFTGKEEDVEVGLAYFGKRFYAPALNRWISADPLTIHGFGGDLNAYAYVSGRALRATDPLGLCSNEGSGGCTASEASGAGPDTGSEGQGNVRPDYGDDPGAMRTYDLSVSIKYTTQTAEKEKQISKTPVASVRPQSALQRAVVYEDYPGSSLAQTAEGDKTLKLAQDVSAGVGITAASMATAGGAGTYAATTWGFGAASSGAVGGAAGGVVSLAGTSTYELRMPTVGEGIQHVGGGALLGGAGGKAAEWGTTKLLQWTTNRANAGFAANPGSVARHVSPRDLSTAAEYPSLMPAIYGKAMESGVKRGVEASPILRNLVRHVGGPSRPDFSGRGWLTNTNWDVTTPGQAAAHLARPGYGEGLNLLTYIRPSF